MLIEGKDVEVDVYILLSFYEPKLEKL